MNYFLTHLSIFILTFLWEDDFLKKKKESAMKKITATLYGISLASILSGCTNTEVGTTVGGATGAGLGYAVSGGSAVGTVIGAGAGALVGNSIGQDQDRRAAYRYYHQPYRYDEGSYYY